MAVRQTTLIAAIIAVVCAGGLTSNGVDAQVTCTNNSPGTNQVTCTGGPGASVNDQDDTRLTVNTGLTNPVDGTPLLIAPTIAGSPFPTSITISGAPAGVTVQNVSVTVNSYVSAGGMAVDGSGNFADGSMAIGLLLTGPKSGGGTTNLELLRCVGGVDPSSGLAAVQNGSFTLVNPGTAGALSIGDETSCDGVTFVNVTPIGPAGAWTPSGGTYAIADYGSAFDVETEPNYNSFSALAGMIGSNLTTLSVPGAGLNVPTLVGGLTTGPSDAFPPNTTIPVSTFAVFTGAPVNGETWNLYLVSDDVYYTSVSFASWAITITYSGATTPSTTTLSPNPSGPFATSPNDTTTLTATVTSGATGTVTFKEGATNLTCSGGNPATLSGGHATCSITYGSNSSEGYHSYTASYSGDGTYESSSGSAGVFVYNHATSSGTTYCNENGIAADGDTPTAPYPSVIYVGDGTSGSPSISNAVETVSVELQNLSSGNTDNMEMLLVAPDGTHAYEFWGFAGVGATTSTGTYTIQDGSPLMPSSFVGPALSPGTYGPSVFDSASELLPDNPAPSPQIPGSFGIAPTQGTATFLSSFTGATANGPWSLFLGNEEGGINTTLTGWCIDITPATGSATTVSVTTTPTTYATKGSPITFTATVTSTGTVNEGLVAFSVANKVTGGITSLGSVAVSGGQASISTSALPEGDQTITAAYTDSGGSFDDNNGTENFRVDAATATPTLSGTTWSYCNTSGITIPGGAGINDIGPAEPNPTNVVVSSLPGMVAAASVTLKNLDLEDPGYIATLLVGPDGASAPTTRQTLDFFSPITSTDGSYVQAVNQTVTFVDGAATVPATLSSNYTLGSQVGPTSNGLSSYTASSFYTLPGTVQHATDEGGFTFSTGTYVSGTGGGVYQSTDGNGIWSLYFNQNTHNGALNPATWCMNLTYTPVTVSVTAGHDGDGHSGDFVQGEQGAQITAAITNEGTGPTGDPDGLHPLTVTDSLNPALTYASGSGTGWSCSAVGQAVTCKNDDAVAQGASYPTLTIDVNVLGSAPASIGNTVQVSGGGVTDNSGNDTITVDPAPVLSVSKTHTGTFTQGSTAVWDITVNNTAAASSMTTGPVTVSDTLPTGYTLFSYSGAGWSCSGSGMVTCTSTQGVAGGSSFATLALTVTVPANSPASVSNTAYAYGGGDVTHTSLGTAATGSDNNVAVVQVPATITVNGSQTQSAQVGTAFGSLAVTVKDAGGVTIPNYSSVTFSASVAGSGATGSFSNSTGTITLSTNGSGVADPGTFTANLNSGSYNVSVSTTTGSASASFSVTNTAITPTITWTPVATVIFGDAGTSVLNAAVNCTVCGTITYTATPNGGSPGSIAATTGLVAGSYTITATYIPSANTWATTSATKPLVVSGESVWIVDGGGGTSELAGNGFGITSSADSGANAAVAIDNAGNVWSVGAGPLLEATGQTGIPQHSINSGGGLNTPAAVAIDGNGQVWVTDGNNAVSLFSNAGAAISPSGGIMDPTLLSSPAGIAVDLAGSVWVANTGNSSLTRILGGAAPVAPLATAAANGTSGARP